jgi:HAD superfamily hydrolase (TIGR01509 family)
MHRSARDEERGNCAFVVAPIALLPCLTTQMMARTSSSVDAAASLTVLLDVDGTLLDSNDAHARAWVDVAREFGYDTPYSTLRPMIGMGGDKLMPKAFGIDHESEQGKAMSKRRSEIFRQRYLSTLKPFPSARALLERMRADGCALVVATSAQKDEMKGLLRAAGIEDLLEDTTSSSDAESSKPDPDIVVAALEKAGVAAAEAIMLGDTPYDVAAATAAGVAIVALECGGWPATELAPAVAVYANPAQLLREYDRSPFGTSARAAARR